MAHQIFQSGNNGPADYALFVIYPTGTSLSPGLGPCNDNHTYGTVVIDSIDWLLRRLEERVAGVNGDPKNMDKTMNRSHGGYGNGKQVLRNYVYQYLLPILDAIVNRGISVVLAAQQDTYARLL